MANFRKSTNYLKKYPNLSDEMIEVLEKSDRKMEYQQYDLKVEQCQIDCPKRTVTYVPSWEDSYERLRGKPAVCAEGEKVEDAAVKAVMIKKMLTCLKLRSTEE